MKLTKSICYIKSSLSMLWRLDRVVVITSVISSLIDAFIPYIGIFLSAHVLDGLQSGGEAREIIYTALIMVGSIFVLTIINSLLCKTRDIHSEMCVNKYYMQVSKRSLTMDYQLLDSPKVNDIRTRIQNDNNWGSGFYSLIWQLPWLLSSVFGLVISLAVLFPLFVSSGVFSHYSAPLMMAAFLGIIIFNSLYSSSKLKKRIDMLNEANLNRGHSGYFMWGKFDYKYGKDIRVYSGQNIIKHYLFGDEKLKRDWIRRLSSNNSLQGFAGGLCAGLLQIIAYLFVALRATSGVLSIGSVLMYAAAIYQFSSALSSVAGAFTEYTVSSQRQQSTLEYISVSDELYKGSLPVEKRRDNEYEIEFHDVSFKYPGSDTSALKNLSMKFKIGQRMAVVGMNGSGKTTMIKLLCRLYDPTEGYITLNGIDIKKYSYDEYMTVFSVVFQDFKLFSFGLGQNVAAGVNYQNDKVSDALKKSGFGERLSVMPKGSDTALYHEFEEDGVEISGGEAQKIALARALYKDAPFIILDEPTAALDPVAEYEIYSRFNDIVGDKTAIYISHRLSSCRFCDDIAVFHEGRLVRRGSHEQLVSENEGIYKQLWTAQEQYYTQA